MKKYILFLLALLFFSNSNAENTLERRSDPNYKNLRLYVKVLERDGKNDFYLAQIDIENTGDSTVSFWETTSNYAWIFTFTKYGIIFINHNQRLNIEKKITESQPQTAVRTKVEILPHTKYTIKTQFYIFNRKEFLKSNKDLRVELYFNDAKLEFMEDPMCPKVISVNAINYNW